MIRRLFLSRESFLFYILAAMIAAFSYFVDGFLDWYGIMERSRYWVIPGMIALPMTFIIATAGIDLSVGSIVAMCSIILGLLYSEAQWPIALAATVAVAAGCSAGAINGGVSSYWRIPPLVVTLATMALFRGIGMGLSEARSVSDFPNEFLWLSQGNAFEIPFSDGAHFPIPLAALLILAVIAYVLMHRSWVGRFTQCIGENPTAAVFAAINVPRLKLGLYTASGLVCGIAALFNTALYATAKADAAMGMELEAIACVVIGGTRISGGRGSIIGTLLGLIIIGMLKYGLEMGGVRSQLVMIFVGILLVITAVLNERLAMRKGAKK